MSRITLSRPLIERAREDLYEANPMSFIITQAGGGASTGYPRIMDVEAKELHQRVGVILGRRNEVERVIGYHQGGQ